MLGKECKEKITAAITAAEASSDAEIICAVADESIDKKLVAYILAVAFTLGASVLLAMFSDIDKIFFLQIQLVLVFVLGGIFIKSANLSKYIVPKKIKFALTKAAAYRNFNALGYDKCKNSIMFFVCKSAKSAHIITGENIAKNITNQEWQELIIKFTQSVEKGEFEVEILKTVEQICALSTQKIPLSGENINEIPNEVVEIR